MSLDQLTKEELQEMALVEIAYEILNDRKEPISFSDLLDKISSMLELEPEEAASRVSQFYTDLNIDGRFINIGGNTWGMKSWYPVDQFDDEIVPEVKTKRKRAKVLDEFEDEYEELEELGEEDADLYDDEDEDLDDEDLDELEEDEDEDDLLDDDLIEDDDLLIDDEFDDDLVEDDDLDDFSDDEE